MPLPATDFLSRQINERVYKISCSSAGNEGEFIHSLSEWGFDDKVWIIDFHVLPVRDSLNVDHRQPAMP